MLPYALLLVAAVVSLFIKGNIVNKIITFLVFGAGMFVVYAESGWWRFAFILLVGLACSTDNRGYSDYKNGTSPAALMGVAFITLITTKWVIADLFGWNPFWWMLVPATVFCVMIICNADYEQD